MTILSIFSCLYENRPLHYTDEEWSIATDHALKFDLAPQLYTLVNQTKPENVPAFVLQKLKVKAVTTVLQNTMIKAETRRVISLLDQIEIPVIALKGTGHAEKYYGHYGARRTSDIDILVPEEKFKEAEARLLDDGYHITEDNISVHFHVSYYKIHETGQPLLVELHSSLLRNYRSRFEIGRLWDEAESLDTETLERQLTLQQTFYTICLHSSNHRMMSYRNALDIAHLIYKYGNQVNYEQLLDRARRDGTFGMVTGALSATYRLFPGLDQVKKLPHSVRRIPWYSEKILLNVDQGKRNYFHYHMYPLITSDSLKTLLLQLWYVVIPPRDQTEQILGETKRLPAPILYTRLYARKTSNLFKYWRIASERRRG